MPAIFQSIDWSGLRAAAVAMQNVDRAALIAGEHLPLDERQRFLERVRKRSQRENWKSDWDRPIAVQNEKPLSSHVQNGAETLAKALADDSAHTRVGFSKAARTVATGLSNKSLRTLTDRDTAQSARQWSEIAGKVHGWDAKQDGAGVNVAVNIGIIGT